MDRSGAGADTHSSDTSAVRLAPLGPTGPMACTVTVPDATHGARPPACVIVAIPEVPTMLHDAVVNAGMTAFSPSRTSIVYWRSVPTSTVPVVGADVTRIVIVVATGTGGRMRPPSPHAGRTTA